MSRAQCPGSKWTPVWNTLMEPPAHREMNSFRKENCLPSGQYSPSPPIRFNFLFQGYPSELGFGYTPVCAHTLSLCLHFHMIDKPLYTHVNQYTYTRLTMCIHRCIMYTHKNNQTCMYTCSYNMLAHTYNIPLYIHAYSYTCTYMCRTL